MLAKMIDKIVSLKETKIFEIDGQTSVKAESYRARRSPRSSSLTRKEVSRSDALT